jgi:hypothetical protein
MGVSLVFSFAPCTNTDGPGLITLCVDPNYANFGVAIPELQAFDEETIAEYFANPQIIPVVPRDPSFQRDSVPSYVADSVSIQSFIKDEGAFPENEDVCLKVLDFGRGKLLASSLAASFTNPNM